MVNGQEKFEVYVDGKLAERTQLLPLSFRGHAHFTATQVRNWSVKGLDFHLARLDEASKLLFGMGIDFEQLSEQLSDTSKFAPRDCSLSITIYSSDGEFTRQGQNARLKTLIRHSPPSDGPKGPFSLKLFRHERHLANIKHVGEIAKTHYMREANDIGFDDALFFSNDGLISEGSIWNVVFWDGQSLVFPKANMLEGTMMQIIKRQAHVQSIEVIERPIIVEDVGEFKCVALMNSWTPCLRVSSIDDVKYGSSEELSYLLTGLYEAEPYVTLI